MINNFYSENNIKLFNGDCIEVMDLLIANNVQIDGVLTSPPYNIIRPNQDDRGYDVYNDGMSNDEYTSWCCEIFKRFDKLLKRDTCVLWNMSYGSENTEAMPLTISKIITDTNYTLADIIVWKKKTATPNAMSKNKRTGIVEFIYVFVRKDEFLTFNTNKKIKSYRKTGQPNYENVYNFIEAKNNDGSCDLNKATYSSDLCNQLLDFYYKENDLILDCFNGTGTTGVSCINLNMQYIGIELSDKQFEYSIDRLKNIGGKNENI